MGKHQGKGYLLQHSIYYPRACCENTYLTNYINRHIIEIDSINGRLIHNNIDKDFLSFIKATLYPEHTFLGTPQGKLACERTLHVYITLQSEFSIKHTPPTLTPFRHPTFQIYPPSSRKGNLTINRHRSQTSFRSSIRLLISGYFAYRPFPRAPHTIKQSGIHIAELTVCCLENLE